MFYVYVNFFVFMLSKLVIIVQVYSMMGIWKILYQLDCYYNYDVIYYICDKMEYGRVIRKWYCVKQIISVEYNRESILLIYYLCFMDGKFFRLSVIKIFLWVIYVLK